MHKPRGILPKLKWGLYKLLPNNWLTVTLPDEKPVLSLTFDDGPHPKYTPQILDLLDQHDIKATFFLIGKHVESYPHLAKDIVSRGHSIGNHSLNHRYFIKMSLAQQMDEISQTETLLQEIDGQRKHAFRPPNGGMNLRLFLQLVLSRTPIVLWSLNSLDYLYKNPKELIDSFSDTTASAGDIILLHDDASHTVEGLKILIPWWKNLGFIFVDCTTAIPNNDAG